MGNYSPTNCVECGTVLTMLTTMPVKLELDNGTAAIPGLYRCTNCEGLIDRGLISSNITEEEAFDYLGGVYIPSVTFGLIVKGHALPEVMQQIAVERLNTAIEIADELVRRLGGEGPDGQVGSDRSAWEQAIDSIRMDADGEASYECPGCGDRHPVEWLFQMQEQQQQEKQEGPEADAA